jgi:predicted permease
MNSPNNPHNEGPENLNQRLDEEISFHIEQQIEKNLRAGMTQLEARRAAHLKFGAVESTREYTRDEFRFAWAYDLIRDLRIAARTLVRTPSYAVAVILTFGLGIGAAASMFSVYDGVLLRPLPYPESDRIVRLYQLNEKGRRNSVSEPNFLDWQQGTRSFSAMAEMARGEAPISGISEPMMAVVTTVSRDFFDIMGVKPAAGRTFLPDEQREGAPRVAVVSASFWKRMRPEGLRTPTNADTLKVGAEVYTIVGVMPKGFDYPGGVSIWEPREQYPAQASRTAHNFHAVARLKDGVSLRDAQADISALSRTLKSRHQDRTWMFDATAIPILEAATGASRQALNMLFAAALLLLAVAAANVSNLMLARAASRRREFAVQLSLGATVGRLRRQALAEALVLCVAGGLLGIGIAAAAVRLFGALGPSSAPRLDTVSVNWLGVLLALAASAGVAIVLSVMTVAGNKNVALAPTLTESSRGGTGSRKQMRLRRGLIVAELALTMVLLVGAGLLAKSLRSVLSVDPGFRLDNALIADVTVPQIEGDRARLVRFQDSLVERVRSLPGVTAAAFINDFPLGGGFYANGTLVEMSRPDEFTSWDPINAMSAEERDARSTLAGYRLAGPGYFEAMRIPLVRGRLIEEQDGPEAPHVAVISESLAKARWPDRDPLGRYVQFGNMDGDFRGIRVVGVVKDVREISPEALPQPTLYAAARQRPVSRFSLVVYGPDPSSLSESVRKIARDLDPEAPVRMRTIEGALDTALGSRRFNLWLVGAFSVVAFALAALGVYGLIAFTASQRTREIGIRMVLGAENTAVLRLILQDGLQLAGIGVSVGLVIALGLMGLLEGLLFGVQPTDPSVIVGVVVTTLLTALVASYIPARRVVRVAPTEALREA